MKSVRWSVWGIAAAAIVVMSGHAQAQPTSDAAGTSSQLAVGTGSGSTATGPSDTASGHLDTVAGRVQKFDRSNNTLAVSGSDKLLKVEPSTQVKKDGARASIDDIKEGEQVRASFSGSGDTPHVQTLDIVGKGGNGGNANVGWGADGTMSSAPSTGLGATASGSMAGSSGITTDLSTGSGTGTGANSAGSGVKTGK